MTQTEIDEKEESEKSMSEFSDWECISEKDLNDLDMPSLNAITDPFKQKWKEVKVCYQNNSKYRHYQSYAIKLLIVKANDDCR